MNYSLTLISRNAKTGPIPVSTSHRDTCPDACPLKVKGCYAAYGPTAIHWNALTEGKRGASWDEFLKEVKGLPRGQLWRHNQAGDLPGNGNEIDYVALAQLAQSNKGKRGFTYTHYVPSIGENAKAIEMANIYGFTINLSGNNLVHADKLKALNIAPVVTILPTDAPNVSHTPAGHKVVACPAEKSDKVNCAKCGLCQDAKRDYIIGFRAHGTAKKTVNLIAKG